MYSEGMFLSALRAVACVVMAASVLLSAAGSGCTTVIDDGGGSEGERLYETEHMTVGAGPSSCAECHGADGTGGPDPEIRGSTSSHLQSHAQGAGEHPEGVKYPDLTHEDFDAIAEFLGGSHSDGHDDDFEGLIGDAQRGQMVFTTPQSTADGVDLSCGSCHRQDGAGAAGPPVRGQSAEHLLEHAQGDGPHPEGIKYPDLVPQGFVDMEAFLADATHGHE